MDTTKQVMFYGNQTEQPLSFVWIPISRLVLFLDFPKKAHFVWICPIKAASGFYPKPHS